MDFLKMMKQAKEMQKKVGDAQKIVGELSVEGQSGGGVVKIILSGSGSMEKISISPDALSAGDAEMLEDLIKSAYSDAWSTLEKQRDDIMGTATSGMKLPF